MPDVSPRRSLLTTALVGALLPADVPEGHMVRAWLDSWSGVGPVVEGMHEQGLQRAPHPVPVHLVGGVLPGTCTVLLWATLGACATVTTPATWQPGNVQPLIIGWQQYFEILWGVTRQDREVLIEGFITNTWGFAARDVRVLVNGYDSSGTQTGQVIAWGPNAIQPGDRVYFDVTVPAGAATYDVSIFSWKWTWPPSGGAGRHEEESRSTKRAGIDQSPGPLTPASALTVTAAGIVPLARRTPGGGPRESGRRDARLRVTSTQSGLAPHGP